MIVAPTVQVLQDSVHSPDYLVGCLFCVDSFMSTKGRVCVGQEAWISGLQLPVPLGVFLCFSVAELRSQLPS